MEAFVGNSDLDHLDHLLAERTERGDKVRQVHANNHHYGSADWAGSVGYKNSPTRLVTRRLYNAPDDIKL